MSSFFDHGDYRIVGAGKGNNFLLHQVYRITVSANGETTSQLDRPSVACK